MISKKGQMTILVIVAVVIVVAVVAFFVIRGGVEVSDIPIEFQPVYASYSECIEGDVKNALDILGTQGGKIALDDYVPGSDFAPFSSHLNFLGIPVGYWYYVSGNGVISEQPPTRLDMEMEVENYLKESIGECDFQEYYEQGFYVNQPAEDEIEVDVKILEEKVEVKVSSAVSVSREERSARKVIHDLEVNSKIGSLYETAREVYNKQIEEAFLEDYAFDTLTLYAPVDGVLVQCNPEIWQTREVVDGLLTGLEANMGAIKFEGDYYRTDDEDADYFVVDLPVDEPVRVLYSKDWASKIEITSTEGELMVAEPVGNQEGLGVMGFCYVPYHFVYDLSFPVLIQVSDGFEIFQFPVVVIIDGNLPREADLTNLGSVESGPNICNFAEGQAAIHTFDSNLNPVAADISYRCIDQTCSLGTTEVSAQDSILQANIPICVNGELRARAEGYVDKEVIFSSNSQSVADIILERSYEIDVSVKMAGKELGENLGVVHFVGSDGYTATAVLPENPIVELKEGSYEVDVKVYGDSGVVIPGSSKTECVEVSRGGVQGLFGATKEECFDIDLPEVRIDQALIGGGSVETFILETELERGSVEIDVSELPVPESIEQLQYNHEVFEALGVQVRFK